MARKFTMAPAKRAGFPVLLGIAGPSSSGKTYTGLRIGTGVQSVVGGELAVLDTEGGRAQQYADKFKFLHVPFAAPFNALSYLEALRYVESQGVRTCIVDSMSHEHEGEGGHLAMHEAEVTRMVNAGWGNREKAGFAAWAKPAAERRALVLYMQQTTLNLILCFRAKEKLVLMKNDRGKMEPTSIGWQPLAGDEYAYEMKAICVLPPRSKGVPDWSNRELAAKISDGMEHIFPKPGEPLDEATGVRFAKWSLGEGGSQRAKPLSDISKPRPAGYDGEAAGDVEAPPAFVPEGGWPRFNKLGQWVRWSIDEFMPKATRPMAEAWSAHYAAAAIRLQEAANNGNEGAIADAAELEKLRKAALKRAG
jgi:hypothetical protein